MHGLSTPRRPMASRNAALLFRQWAVFQNSHPWWPIGGAPVSPGECIFRAAHLHTGCNRRSVTARRGHHSRPAARHARKKRLTTRAPARGQRGGRAGVWWAGSWRTSQWSRVYGSLGKGKEDRLPACLGQRASSLLCASGRRMKHPAQTHGFGLGLAVIHGPGIQGFRGVSMVCVAAC